MVILAAFMPIKGMQQSVSASDEVVEIEQSCYLNMTPVHLFVAGFYSMSAFVFYIGGWNYGLASSLMVATWACTLIPDSDESPE